jgi:hypothetical protein
VTGGLGNRFLEIDRNIAVNLRIYSESDSIGQGELAQRMNCRGSGFTQAVIWKIESGQHPINPWLDTKAEKYSSPPHRVLRGGIRLGSGEGHGRAARQRVRSGPAHRRRRDLPG